MSIDFLKLNINIFDHKKIKIIRKYPGGDQLFIVWVWLLCESMKSDHPGYVYIAKDLPYEKSDIAADLSLEIKTVELAMELFTKLKMVDVLGNGVIEVLNFNKYQRLDKIEKAKELSRETSKRYREKQKQLISDTSLTKSDGVDTESDTDKTKTQTKTQTKKKIKKPVKNKHLDFILLTTAEHESLIKKYGKTTTNEYIERINNYVGSTGRRYKSHYYAILQWMKKDDVKKLPQVKVCPDCKTEVDASGWCNKCEVYIVGIKST